MFVGSIEWLFDDQFCNFICHQLCFNIGIGYQAGNYSKQVMHTTCLDCFSNHDGQAPPGCVSLYVFGNHIGAAMKYHHVPMCFLTPASPTTKDQLVLVLQGDWRGSFCRVIRWIRKEKKAVVTLIDPSSSNQVTVFPAEDICLALSI
ncbi:hypothetical protein J3R82DRAFT_6997 [Butyriboletus roseoflavus]|nr:hypothetical protein J3R82DRAFT_6997 [Butyriboletus roseoflavus]